MKHCLGSCRRGGLCISRVFGHAEGAGYSDITKRVFRSYIKRGQGMGKRQGWPWIMRHGLSLGGEY